MSDKTELKYHPDAEYRFFIYDPEGNGFMYFSSVTDRDIYQGRVLDGYLDDGWDDAVEQVVAGEVTHSAQQVNREERPPAEEIDENGCDGEGSYWDESWSYRCNYKLKPIADVKNEEEMP